MYSQTVDSLSAVTGPESFIIDTSYFEKYDAGFNLILAADRGDLLAMEILLRRGINPDYKTFDGITPLMYASEKENAEAVLMLLEHGADPDIMPPYGPNALISSSKIGSLVVAGALLEYGASINEKDANGLTALMYAAANDFSELTELFMSYGADPSLKDGFGSDALIIAAYYGSYESAEILIEYGCNINSADNFGFTPLIAATQSGHYDMVWLLLENGADLLQKNQAGINPLAMAVTRGHNDIAELLIENGAKVNDPVHKGHNLLDIASEKENEEMAALLKTNGARSNHYPYFNLFSAGVGIDFSSDDFMTGLNAGIYESKYGVELSMNLNYRPAPIRVMVEDDDEIAFQFWERRWIATAGIQKRFRFETLSGQLLGPYLELDVNYTWGSYRGADRKPHPAMIFSPAGGFFWKINFLGLDLKYSYKKLDIPHYSPHRISLGFIYYFNIRQEKLMFKEISWF